jgi:hypothetical protein
MAKILRETPDGSISESLAYILEAVRRAKSRPSERPTSPSTTEQPLSTEILERVGQMPAAELEKYLATAPEFSSLTKLRELAERVGISTGRKQSHAALTNTIVKHYEGRQIDSIIRSGREPMEKDETKPGRTG